MLRRIAVLLMCAAALDARITRIVIDHRASQGKSLTGAGQYELLTGLFYGELDTKDPHNTIINDIALAPVNARGKVEYTGTFALAKPVDMSKSSGVLYYLVPNRGNGSAALYEEGHVTVISGWQGDLPPRAGIQY